MIPCAHTTDPITLRVPGETHYLELIRSFARGLADIMGFDAQDTYKIELAVDEACTNVIRHAYAERCDGQIEIVLDARSDRLVITVADEGIGFEPAESGEIDVLQLAEAKRRDGLGLFLVRKMMDEVRFAIVPGVRNQVIMVKRLKGAPPTKPK